MKIMVGYDGSFVAQDALSLAMKHAKVFGAHIDVVTSMIKGTEHQMEDIQKAEQDLKEIKEMLQRENIPCETHLLIRGLEPGEDLVQFARENDVDEIFVGVKKRSKVEKILLGSSARYVILNAPCPVMSVK